MKPFKNRPLTIALLSLALVAIVAGGVTSAYYTADAGAKVNIFAFENGIRARLDEYNWDGTKSSNMVPGKQLRKDPVITNVCQMDEYVAVRLVFEYNDQQTVLSQTDYERLMSLVSIDWNVGQAESQWTLVAGAGTPQQIYVYNQKLSPGEVSEPVFHSVRIHTKADADKPMTEADLRWLQGIKLEDGQVVADDQALGGFHIRVQGGAIQAESLATPADAYTGLQALFS